VKVIISSGFSPDEPVEEALGRPLKGFLRKPYTMREMLDSVGSALVET
jgi:hypothetical protein